MYQITISMIKKCTTKARNTIVVWINLCRGVAVAIFNKCIKMGGPGEIILTGMSLF